MLNNFDYFIGVEIMNGNILVSRWERIIVIIFII